MNKSKPVKKQENEEIYCLDCEKYFKDIKLFNEV